MNTDANESIGNVEKPSPDGRDAKAKDASAGSKSDKVKRAKVRVKPAKAPDKSEKASAKLEKADVKPSRASIKVDRVATNLEKGPEKLRKAAAKPDKRAAKVEKDAAQPEKRPAKAEKYAAKPGKRSAGKGLELIKEARLADLLVEVMEGQYESSGVHQRDGLLYIVFDNYPNIACLTTDLEPPADRPALIRQRGERIGYEDVTYHAERKRWYCLIEATEYEPDLYRSRVEEYDETFRFIESLELDFKIKGSNKGIEGLSFLHYKGEEYLLALCEGNACKSGAAAREGGKGRILLFQRGFRRWEHAGTVKLPKSVGFADYSALDIRDGWIAVVSQESSALWVSRMRAEPTGLDNLWEDDGRIFKFPRDKKGRPLYCNIEGVTWIREGVIAVVSDRAKSGKQPSYCADRDQAVHIFKLPA